MWQDKKGNAVGPECSVFLCSKAAEIFSEVTGLRRNEDSEVKGVSKRGSNSSAREEGT